MFDTSGNVSEWVEDCWHKNYKDAPTDGSAWLSANEGDCERRVLRSGNYYDNTDASTRSASRNGEKASDRSAVQGFRIARTLSQ